MGKVYWYEMSAPFLSMMFETFFTSIVNGQEVERGDMDWIDLAQVKNMCGTFVNAVTNLRVA